MLLRNSISFQSDFLMRKKYKDVYEIRLCVPIIVASYETDHLAVCVSLNLFFFM
jgi:hypothetical protein